MNERTYVVSYRTPLSSKDYRAGSFSSTEENLGGEIAATLGMGYVITEVRIREWDEV